MGAICEAPLRLKDVPAALAVCSALHQRYADFAKELVGTLVKLCASTGGAGCGREKRGGHVGSAGDLPAAAAAAIS